jgi:ABC-type nickel/cobalt efflux system permease component RcnA
MKRVVLLVALVAGFAMPVAASAHPLGNFTVNRFSRIQAAEGRIYVKYVLDLAEIPTFQAGSIDEAAYAARIARGVELRVDGVRTELGPVSHALADPTGAAGLKTTRLEVILRGPRLAAPARVQYRDRNYAGRIGWSEVVVGDAESVSDELSAYPKDELASPLSVTTADVSLAPSDAAAPVLDDPRVLDASSHTQDTGFASLIGRGDLSWLVIVSSLAVAFFWGAAHALSPGHGKTIVTAYLVGQRGTPRHAALLGLITTSTHTVGVFALGLFTLALSQFIVPETLYPWINLLSGLLVVGIGAAVLSQRWRAHEHHHGHSHNHAPKEPGLRGLVAVGVSGGILPCPSALVVLLAAISLHRVVFGMVLIIAFSAGLALAITGIGLVAVLAKRFVARASFEGGLVRLLPAASALVILAVGVGLTLNALPEVL